MTMPTPGAPQLLHVLTFLGSFILLNVASGDTVRTYQIGNSLTVTATPSGALRSWLEMEPGNDARTGMHISCGQPLISSFNDPDATCVTPPFRGRWDNALNNYADWDHIVFQPFASQGSKLSDDLGAIEEWVRAVSLAGNTDVDFYVMQSYPDAANFRDEWLSSPSSGPDPPTQNSREYYQLLMSELRLLNLPAEMFLIPTGEIFAELDVRLEANPIQIGSTLLSGVEDLYRDDVHGNQYGGFASGAGVYASLLGVDSNSLTTTNSGLRFGLESDWSPELYEMIHESVGAAHRSTFGARELATAVPEPSSTLGFTTGVILLLRNRRRDQPKRQSA